MSGGLLNLTDINELVFQTGDTPPTRTRKLQFLLRWLLGQTSDAEDDDTIIYLQILQNLADVDDVDLSRANLLAAPLYIPVTNDAGASYTFTGDDAYTHQRFTSATAVAATVPKNSTEPIPVGTRIRGTQAGAGQITLTPEDGTVTLNSADSALKSRVHFSVFEIVKVDVDEWDVLGDVTT